MRTPRRWLGGLLAGVLLLATTAPARAQEAEKYLPADTDFVVRINLKQLLGSELVRKAIPAVAHKYGDQFVEMAKAFGALNDDLAKALKDGTLEALIAGMKDQTKVNQMMDQMKEAVTDIVVAGSGGGEEPKMLIFVRSPILSMPMVSLMLSFVEKSQPGMLKKDKVGKHTVFELAPPGQDKTFHIVIPVNGLVVMSPSKEHLTAALEAAEGTKSGLSKEFKELLGQFKPSQSVFFAGRKMADSKPLVTLGSVTIDDGVTADFSLDTGSPDAAKEKAKEMNDQLEEGLSGIAGLLGESEEAKALLKAVEGVKAKADGSKVVIQVRLSDKVFAPLLKIEKKDEEKKDKSDK